MNGNARGRPFHPDLSRGGIDQPNIIQLIVADQAKRRQQQRLVNLAHQALGRESGSAEGCLDVGARGETGSGRIGGAVSIAQLHHDGAGNGFGHRERGRRHLQLRPQDPIIQHGERSARGRQKCNRQGQKKGDDLKSHIGSRRFHRA